MSTPFIVVKNPKKGKKKFLQTSRKFDTIKDLEDEFNKTISKKNIYKKDYKKLEKNIKKRKKEIEVYESMGTMNDYVTKKNTILSSDINKFNTIMLVKKNVSFSDTINYIENELLTEYDDTETINEMKTPENREHVETIINEYNNKPLSELIREDSNKKELLDNLETLKPKNYKEDEAELLIIYKNLIKDLIKDINFNEFDEMEDVIKNEIKQHPEYQSLKLLLKYWTTYYDNEISRDIMDKSIIFAKIQHLRKSIRSRSRSRSVSIAPTSSNTIPGLVYADPDTYLKDDTLSNLLINLEKLEDKFNKTKNNYSESEKILTLELIKQIKENINKLREIGMYELVNDIKDVFEDYKSIKELLKYLKSYK